VGRSPFRAGVFPKVVYGLAGARLWLLAKPFWARWVAAQAKAAWVASLLFWRDRPEPVSLPDRAFQAVQRALVGEYPT
jgi:hypothetical protein